MHEVQRIAVQLVADAHIRGQLKKECVQSTLFIIKDTRFNHLFCPSWLAYLTVNELGDVVLQSASPSECVKIRRGCKFFLF